MTRRRRPWRDERGVSLVLVLVTLVIFGLIVPVLGQFGSVNGVSGYVLKGNRFDRYAGEAGMQGAIQWAQATAQRQAGRQGTKCPDISPPTLNANDGPNASRTVTVQCAGFDGNGLPQATDTIPQYALLALGSGAAIKIDSSGKLRTDGAWWSNGSIDKGASTVDASADYVGAVGACDGITASPSACGAGPANDDPDYLRGYPYPALQVDGIRSQCEGITGGIAHIAPGLHWQADYFNTLAGCRGLREIDLEGGAMPHLFDFTFYGGSENTWTVDPPGGATVRVRNGTVSASDPASCGAGISPILFGDNFALQANAGASLELCGADENGQQVATAQVPLGHTVPTPEPPSTSSNRVVVDGLDAVQPPQAAAWPGAVSGIDCVRTNDCPTGSFVSGVVNGSRATGEFTFDIPDPIPDGAWLKRVTIELSHLEQQAHGQDLDHVRVWLTGLPPGYDAACALSDDQHEISDASSWATASENQLRCDVDGANIPYFSTGNLKVHVALDTNRSYRQGDQTITPQVALGIDHLGLRARFTPAGYRTSTATQAIDVENQAIFHAVGTVYLPRSALNVSFGDATSSTFERGVIVSNVLVKHLGNAPAFTPFSLPNGGDYSDRLATFRAFLGTNPDFQNDTPILTSRVQFCDAHPDGTVVRNVSGKCKADGIAGGPAKILAWDPKR